MIRSFVNKYYRLSLPVKAAFWFTICNILQKGISVITVPIFTRLMSTEQYGTYSLYLSWLNIFTIFTSLNLYYGVFNKAMIQFEEDRDRYISSMQGLCISITMLWGIIYFVFRIYFEKLFGLSTILMFMMFIELLVTPSLQFWSGKQRFEYKYKSLVFVTMLKSIFNPIIGMIVVILTAHKTEARVAATVFVEVIICGIIMIFLFGRGKCFYVYDYWKYALGFNIPLMPHYLSGSILSQGDRIIIGKILGSSSIALYSVAYNVGMLTQLVTNAVSQSITPWLYNCLKNKDCSEIRYRFRSFFILVAGIVCILMLFAPEIISIFASEEYIEAVYVIPPVSASVYFIFVYNIFSNFEFYYEKKLFILIASIISALINVILNFLFIPLFGYIAAAYTTLFCYILYSFAHFAFSRSISKQEIGNTDMFSIIDLIVISSGVIIYTILVNLLYINALVRLLVIVLVAITSIVFRKEIGNAMKLAK